MFLKKAVWEICFFPHRAFCLSCLYGDFSLNVSLLLFASLCSSCFISSHISFSILKLNLHLPLFTCLLRFSFVCSSSFLFCLSLLSPSLFYFPDILSLFTKSSASFFCFTSLIHFCLFFSVFFILFSFFSKAIVKSECARCRELM